MSSKKLNAIIISSLLSLNLASAGEKLVSACPGYHVDYKNKSKIQEYLLGSAAMISNHGKAMISKSGQFYGGYNPTLDNFKGINEACIQADLNGDKKINLTEAYILFKSKFPEELKNKL